jgi:hypothetical protein
MPHTLDAQLPYDQTNPHIEKFIQNMLSPLKQKFFLFAKVPGAWFMGVKVQTLTHEKSEVALNYSWWSQNPFKSIYFAAQAAAAELSTGVVAFMAIEGRGQISMLVAGMEAKFVKKATQKTVFTCNQTQLIFDAVSRAIETGEGQTVTVESVGVQADGSIVSKFYFTWSFKVKKQ